MEESNIILSKISQSQKAKNHMFSLINRLQIYNKCSNIIGYRSHTKGRSCKAGIRKGKETKNLNVVDMLTV
jgi:hypothetical protein